MKGLSERKRKWIERTVANNRNYKLYLYNRFLVFLLLVLFQLVTFVVFAYLVAYNTKIGVAAQLMIVLLALLVVLRLISKNDRPSIKLNWIMLIILTPVVGVPSYFMYGEGRPTKRMRKKLDEAQRENKRQFVEVYGEMPILEAQDRQQAVSHFLAKYASYPAYQNGGLDYFSNGEKMFDAMLEALSGAERFILLDYFIIAHGKMWNAILKLLLEKAMAGVQVRIIYDDFGCMMTLPPRYNEYLEGLHENIKCMTFNNVVPVFALRMNNRDHRKIMVVDGKIAFTGGINLADEYIGEKKRFGYWKDSGVRVTGDAVASFTKMFFDLWNAFRKDKEDLKNYLLSSNEGGMSALNANSAVIQPYDDSPLDAISSGETVYMDMIDRAQKYVYIFTPYLVLDDFMRAALIRAAMRGVDVRIVTPGVPDKKITFRLTRANYDMLLRVGIKIYEYTPGFIHAKSVVCDDECAVVGTINFDYRSLYHHFENAVYFSHCQAVADVKRDCEETFAVSMQCTRETVKRTPFGRMLDALLRVFETMF